MLFMFLKGCKRKVYATETLFGPPKSQYLLCGPLPASKEPADYKDQEQVSCLYVTSSTVVSPQGGDFGAIESASSLGPLPLHPLILSYVDLLA